MFHGLAAACPHDESGMARPPPAKAHCLPTRLSFKGTHWRSMA